MDVQRQTTGGFARGQLLMRDSSGTGGNSRACVSGSETGSSSCSLRIIFQNENLLAYEEDEKEEEEEKKKEETVAEAEACLPACLPTCFA